MAETATAPETATTESAKAEDVQGSSIITTKEPEIKVPEKTLFKTGLTVEEAKAAAIKELADDTTKTTEKTATDTKAPTEPAKTPDKATTTAPTDYTLDLPENSALTKDDLASTLKEAKEAGLSADEAKEMLQSKDQVARSAQTRLAQQQEQQLKSMVAEWKESVKNDPEIGGEKLAETAIKASRAAKAIFDSDTLKFLEKTGYGDNPGLVKAMVKVYDLIGEDKFIRGSTGASNSSPTTMEEKAKKLFSNPIKTA